MTSEEGRKSSLLLPSGAVVEVDEHELAAMAERRRPPPWRAQVPLPHRQISIDVPAFMRWWQVQHLAFPGRVQAALRHKGVVTLGGLHGRRWGFIYDLKDVGQPSARVVFDRLEAAKEGLIPPPAPAPLPPEVTLPRSPGLLLDWLLRASRPRQMEVALRYLVDRPTLEEMGCEMNITRERVRSLVVVGKSKARRHLADVSGWPPIVVAASEVLDALTVVSAHGLYEVLSQRLSWEPNTCVSEVRALCALLAMHDELVVLRRGEVMAVCRSTKAARAWIEFLERADDRALDEARRALPHQLVEVFDRDRFRLLELAGRERTDRGRW